MLLVLLVSVLVLMLIDMSADGGVGLGPATMATSTARITSQWRTKPQ
jgi:hypothetical protein